MRRLVFVFGGLVLLTGPAWFVADASVPVARFRTGTWADYRTLGIACLTLYGGAGAGLLACGMRRGWQVPRMTAATVFRACMVGIALALCLLIAIAGFGNQGGVVVILGLVVGAVIAAGAALLWRALPRSSAPGFW